MLKTLGVSLAVVAVLFLTQGYADALKANEVLQLADDRNVLARGGLVRAHVSNVLSMRNDAPEGCESECLGRGEEGSCRGLFKMTCKFESSEGNVTVMAGTRIACLGLLEDTEDEDMKKTTCKGLFSEKSVVGFNMDEGEEEEEGDDPGLKDHDHPDFDVVVFVSYTCGTDFLYTVSPPDYEGVSSKQTIDCEKAEIYSVAAVKEMDMPTAEDLSLELEKLGVTASQSPNKNIQYLDDMMSVLADVPVPNTSDNKGGEDLPDEPEWQKALDMNVTCNGEPAEFMDDCDGEFFFEFKEEGDYSSGEAYVKNTCKGKWRGVGDNLVICEGRNEYDEEASGENRDVTKNSVCEGREIVTFYKKDIHDHDVEGSTSSCLGSASTVIEVTMKGEEPETEPSFSRQQYGNAVTFV